MYVPHANFCNNSHFWLFWKVFKRLIVTLMIIVTVCQPAHFLNEFHEFCPWFIGCLYMQLSDRSVLFSVVLPTGVITVYYL